MDRVARTTDIDEKSHSQLRILEMKIAGLDPLPNASVLVFTSVDLEEAETRP